MLLHNRYSDVAWAWWRLRSPASRLFTQQLVRTNIKGKIKTSALLTLCDGNPRWPVDSPLKGPVMRKAVPCHNLIMNCDIFGAVGPLSDSFIITTVLCNGDSFYDQTVFWWSQWIYIQTSNISRTKYQDLTVSRLVMQYCRRQVMHQLHLSDQQFYCLPRYDLY